MKPEKPPVKTAVRKTTKATPRTYINGTMTKPYRPEPDKTAMRDGALDFMGYRSGGR